MLQERHDNAQDGNVCRRYVIRQCLPQLGDALAAVSELSNLASDPHAGAWRVNPNF